MLSDRVKQLLREANQAHEEFSEEFSQGSSAFWRERRFHDCLFRLYEALMEEEEEAEGAK